MKNDVVPSSAATINLLFGLISFAFGTLLIWLCTFNLVKILGYAYCVYAIYRLVSAAICAFDIQEQNMVFQAKQIELLEDIKMKLDEKTNKR